MNPILLDITILFTFFALWFVFCWLHERLTTKPRGATRKPVR